MPVDRHLQSSLASGEFDPLLFAREDVSFYYSAAFRIENVIVLPQGGGKRREGLRILGVQRGILTDLDMTDPNYSIVNGGTEANLYSTDPASKFLTTGGGIGTGTNYSVITLDYTTAQRISLFDLNVALVGGNLKTCDLALEGSTNGSTWVVLDTLTVGRTAYDRRFALAPDADLGEYRYFRLNLLNPDALDYGACEIEIYKAQAWTEAGYSQASTSPGEVKLQRITTGFNAEYWVVLSDRTADIYTSAGVWQASCLIPHTDAQVSEIKVAQQRDTMVIYQQDQHPYVIQRLDGVDDRWRSGEFAFRDIATFPFEDATTGGQNEIQELKFASMSAGNRFFFEFNGELSDEIEWSATAATNITNITTALEALPDINSVTVTNPAGSRYEVEFDGVDALTFFATIVVAILDGTGTVENTRLQRGRPNQENLWSADRGYASCGTFYQGRHWMGGFKARPDVLIGSQAGDLSKFKEDADPVSTSPLVLVPDIDEQVEIENLHAGRNLQIFTSSAEIYIPSEPITPSNVALKVSSRRGSQSFCQPVDVQGGTFFVDRNGTALREYLFQDTVQSYTAEPISTLGGHLVRQPRDLALRLSVDPDEPTVMYLVNTGRDRGGDLVPSAICTIDRAQQITAFSRLTTALGTFLSVAASKGGDVAMIVQRALAGNEWNYLELFDENCMGDASQVITNTDIDEFTATAAQTVFTYTFTNPIDANDIAVFQRADDSDIWRRIEQSTYTLDTGAKTVTLATGLDAGVNVAIALRQTNVNGVTGYLEGIECYVHGDGRPFGLHTPASNSVLINGDEGFFFEARIGLHMVPDVVLLPYKGKGGQSPTMQRQRIFGALLNMERTSHIAVGMEGDEPKAVALTNYDALPYDLDLEEILFSGLKRVRGIGRWQLEPKLRITQTEPGPWLMRAATYDIRF